MLYEDFSYVKCYCIIITIMICYYKNPLNTLYLFRGSFILSQANIDKINSIQNQHDDAFLFADFLFGHAKYPCDQ